MRLVALLPLPFCLALGALGSGYAADSASRALGRALGAVAAVVGAEPTPSRGDDEAEAAEQELTIPASVHAGATEAAPERQRGKRGKASRGAPPRGVFVSAKRVLELAETRIEPRAVRVRAEGARPAGLRLSGVAALGIGLRDGDVLTRALGRPALSSTEVVRAILAARSKGVRVLEGEVWRGQTRFAIQVEQPYLD